MYRLSNPNRPENPGSGGSCPILEPLDDGLSNRGSDAQSMDCQIDLPRVGARHPLIGRFLGS